MQSTKSYLVVIEKAIISGFEEYSETLDLYWPSPSEIAGNTEACGLFYVASALRTIGFTIFSECPDAGDHQKHIDFLGINKKTQTIIGVEGKRLYSGEKAVEISNDIQRLINFKLNEDELDLDDISQQFRVIIATTWNDSIAKWWKSDDLRPDGFSAEGWEILYNTWDKSIPIDASYDVVDLYSDNDTGENYYGLYLLFPIK